MTDQLSLDLETGLPHAPARLRPMLPRPAVAPFDSAAHLFEPSWGGERVLAFIEPAVQEGPQGFTTADGRPSLRLVDGGGRDVAPRLPELRPIPLRLESGSAVVDGELVVVGSGGRPDPGALGDRLDGRPGPDVAFLVFDVLYLDGSPLLGRPLVQRREALRRVLRPGPEIVAVPAIPGEGIALYEAVLAQGLAGVLARQRTGPYLPGVRSRLWRWIPARPVTEGPKGVPDPEVRGDIVPGARRRERGRDAAPEPAPWSAMEAGGEGHGPGDTEDTTLDRSGTAVPGPAGGSAAGVIAVFRRLPLDLDEHAGPR